MSKQLLLDEQPLIILPQLATKIGLNNAIVLQQVHYWANINMKSHRNNHNGIYWVFNSYPDWQKNNFPFWSVQTVKRIFQKCEKDGFLTVGNFNKLSYDRTKWYSIDYETLGIDPPWGQIEPIEGSNMTPPIPETTETM